MLLDTINENKRQLLLLKEQYSIEEESHSSVKQLDFILEEVASIKATWQHLDEQEKQALIRDCVDHINIYKDKVEIFYTFIKTEGATKKAA